MIEDDHTYHSKDAVSIHTASISEVEGSVQEIEAKETMLYDRIKACRLDRERLKVVDEVLKQNDTQLEMIQAKVRTMVVGGNSKVRMLNVGHSLPDE
jgi:hypothetical protein